MKKIKTVGVVGAGTMGAALAQKFAQEGFEVLLADREQRFVDKGMQAIRNSLDEAQSRNLITADQSGVITWRIKGTIKLEDFSCCDLVVEAIIEKYDAKQELFEQLSAIVSPETILATNTSSYSVTELSASVKNPGRFAGLHFFYHAAKNRLVEIIPGEKTSPDTLESLRYFSAIAGKDPIVCADAYGFVVNRFFVPWLNEAVRIYAEKIASMETIDAVCCEVFGIGMGPFALMNATGVPVAYHAEKTLEIFGPAYRVSDMLKLQAESKQPWSLEPAGPGHVEPEVNKKIAERMTGIVFLVCSQILDENICGPAEIDRGAKIGLKWKKGPVEMMEAAGENNVIRLIVNTLDLYPAPLPEKIGVKYWKKQFVKTEIKMNVAVITLDRPEDLNALNEEVMKQLSENFSAAEKNPTITTVLITGSGKAFVAGADIRFFVNNIRSGTLNKIQSFTKFGQDVFSAIDNSKKHVVAVVNGLALGGGLELALCADSILALPKAMFSFPETGIGIYPGLGGTQRSVSRLGKGLSRYLIHTGKMIGAGDALEIGLADAVVSPDVIREMILGARKFPEKKKGVLPDKWARINDFFVKNSITAILSGTYRPESLPDEEATKISKGIRQKAPLAVKLADKLIEEAGGCETELEHLREIFSTSDALLGLTSIGKKVEYQGR